MNLIRRLCRAGVQALPLLALPLLAGPADLAPLRGVFEAHLAQYESEYSAEWNAWVEAYRDKLVQLAQAAQRAGLFEAWQEATRETERFAKDQRIPEATPPEASETLKALHARNRATVAQCALRRMQRTLDLVTKYLARIEALKAEATRQGAFEEAAAWQAEVQRVEALPLVQRAREETAAAATVAETAAEAAAEVPPAAVEGSETPAAADSPEGVVWSEGLTPPVVPGLTFRLLTLSVTERMRVARRLGGRAELAVSTATQRDDYSRSRSSTHVLRLGLRPADARQAVEGAVLLVDFFGKEAARRGAHIVPRPIGSIKLALPRLDGTRWTFVQLPPVSTGHTVHRYPFFNADQRFGLEFYGAVISVFDAAGALQYQAISAANLATVAPEKLPEAPPQDERESPPWPQGAMPRPAVWQRPSDAPRPAFGER